MTALALRLALRDLRGGIAGLRLLWLCLLLSVFALAGIGSLSDAVLGGLAGRGRELLGGDIALRLAQRPANSAERAALAGLGTVSESLRLTAMVGSTRSDDR